MFTLIGFAFGIIFAPFVVYAILVAQYQLNRRIRR